MEQNLAEVESPNIAIMQAKLVSKPVGGKRLRTGQRQSSIVKAGCRLYHKYVNIIGFSLLIA